GPPGSVRRCWARSWCPRGSDGRGWRRGRNQGRSWGDRRERWLAAARGGAARRRDLRADTVAAAGAWPGHERPAEHGRPLTHSKHTVTGAVGRGRGAATVVVDLEHDA